MTVIDATGRKFESALSLVEEHQREFQLCFGSPAGKQVVEHLKLFCHAEKTTVALDQRDLTYVLEGRRQVYLRIMEYMNLPPEQLLRRRYPTPLEATGDKANV